MEVAQENSIDIPDTLLNAVNQNKSEYEEEVIMSFARKTFGGQFVEWTIEQKHWFGEMMIAIGFREQNNDCIPKDGEISFEQALAIIISSLCSTQECSDYLKNVGLLGFHRFDIMPKGPIGLQTYGRSISNDERTFLYFARFSE